MKTKLYILSFLFIVITTGISQNLKPTDNLALLKGIVTNFQGKVLSNETIIFSNDKTKDITKVNTDEKGKFEVLVPVNGIYSLKYKNFTTDMDYTKMNVPVDKNATYNITIKLDPPKEFVLENVYFDSGKSILKPNSYKALNDLVEILKLKKTMVIEIQGHTDNVGNSEDNLKLSQERANEVRKYIISKGIEEIRVVAKGYGQTMPIADNLNDAGKSQNRRTALKVIKD